MSQLKRLPLDQQRCESPMMEVVQEASSLGFCTTGLPDQGLAQRMMAGNEELVSSVKALEQS